MQRAFDWLRSCRHNILYEYTPLRTSCVGRPNVACQWLSLTHQLPLFLCAASFPIPFHVQLFERYVSNYLVKVVREMVRTSKEVDSVFDSHISTEYGE